MHTTFSYFKIILKNSHGIYSLLYKSCFQRITHNVAKKSLN